MFAWFIGDTPGLLHTILFQQTKLKCTKNDTKCLDNLAEATCVESSFEAKFLHWSQGLTLTLLKAIETANSSSWCSLLPTRGCLGAGSLHTRAEIAMAAAQPLPQLPPGHGMPMMPMMPSSTPQEELLGFLQQMGQNPGARARPLAQATGGPLLRAPPQVVPVIEKSVNQSKT